VGNAPLPSDTPKNPQMLEEIAGLRCDQVGAELKKKFSAKS